MRRAYDLGADGVELDVQRCGSGEIVVFHDFDLRAFGRAGLVSTTTMSELRRLDLGGGCRIPTLDELLAEAPPALLLNIELKAQRLRTGHLERDVVECVRRHGVQARVLVSSFNPVALLRVKRLAPEVRVGFLFHGGQSRAWRRGWATALRPDAFHPEKRLVDAAFMEWARAKGARVHPFTVDAVEEMERLLGLGVHGLITNRPDRMAALVGPRR
jgi:glycerophosphoryl diester phosphodiesterase